MKENRRTHVSYVIYKYNQRKQQFYGRYKTLVEAYEALMKMEFKTGSAVYDLVEYAELLEQVWASNQWVQRDTIGIYELIGTPAKKKVVLDIINREYKQLHKPKQIRE